MLSFSLDTNCIIALDEGRPESNAIRALADAHAAGVAKVGLVAISASERQRDRPPLTNFTLFQERITSLGLAHLELLYPMGYFNVTFFNACLLAGPEMRALETTIQGILFPTIPVSWPEYCRNRGLDPEANTRDRRKWKNAKCDVQAFWCHTFRHRDVFVTTDRRFHSDSRKARLIALAGGRIELPEAAADLIRPKPTI
jgi:hypothetical protein